MADMKFGVMSTWRGDYTTDNLEDMFRLANELGFDSIMFCALITDEVKQQFIERTEEVKGYIEKYGYDETKLDQYQKRGLVNRYKAFTNPRRMPTYFCVAALEESEVEQ